MPRRGDEWINTGLLVLGGLGTISAVATWLSKDLTVVLAFTAGGGWLLSIPLLIMVRRASQEMDDLKTEIRDLRQQAGEWRGVAIRDSESLNTLITRAVELPRVAARRQSPVPSETSVAQSEGQQDDN